MIRSTQGLVAELASVLTEVSGDVACLTLSAPDRRNPVSRAVQHELGTELQRVTCDGGVRFVVLRGEGGNFSSGGDLEELKDGLPSNYVPDYWERMGKTVLHLRNMDQIVICAVQGVALGAGAALALAGDVVLAEDNARFRFQFVHLGLMPDAGTSWLLPTAVGLPVARDLLLTGRWMSALEAHQRGLIARIVPVGSIETSITSLLDELRTAPKEALSLAKNLLRRDDFSATVRMEGIYQQAAAANGTYLTQIAELHRVLKASAPEPH